MKTLFVFVLLLIFCLKGFSQTEFAPIGAEWYYSAPGLSGNPLYSYEKYVSRRDTVIEGKVCKIIRSQNFSEVMYEADSKVYYRFRNDFKLIYDFDVTVGDTIGFDFKSYSPNSYKVDTTYLIKCVVEQIDTIVIRDQKLRKIYTSVIRNNQLTHLVWLSEYIYIEKVGYDYDFMYILPIPSIESMHNLRCYNDQKVNYISDWWNYQNKACDFSTLVSKDIDAENHTFSVTPNPVSDVIAVTVSNYNSSEQYRLKLYDSTGTIVLKVSLNSSTNVLDLSQLAKGIYYIIIHNNSFAFKPYKIIKL